MSEHEKKLLEALDTPAFGVRGRNPRACRSCRFSHGDPPFEDSPEKAYCRIYSRDEGEQKPPEIYYDGKDCPHWAAEK